MRPLYLALACVSILPPLSSTAQDSVGGTLKAESSQPARMLVALGVDRFQTRDFVQSIAFSPSGDQIATSESNSPARVVRMFDVATGEQMFALADPDRKAGWVTCLAFSPDGSALLCGEIQGHITLWDLKTKMPLWRGKSYVGDVESVGFSPVGKWFVTAGTGGDLSIYALENGQPTGKIKVVGRTRNQRPGQTEGDSLFAGSASMCFTADGKKVIVAGSRSGGSVSIVDLNSATVEQRISLNSNDMMNHSVNYVGLLADGKSIVTAGQKTVKRAETGIKYGPENLTLTQLKIWELDSGKHQRDLQEKDQYGSGRAALSPNASKLAVSDFSMLTYRDVSSGTVLWRTELPGNWGGNPAISPDGKLIAIPQRNGLALFDAVDGKQLHRDGNRSSEVTYASWSHSGDEIVSGHRDGFVRIWDADSGLMLWQQQLSPVVSLSGWNALPNFVTLSKDGSTLIAAGQRDDPVEWRKGVIVGWDRETERELFRTDFEAEVRAAAISHDGRHVVVATSNGSIRDTHLFGIDTRSGEKTFANPAEDVLQGLWGVKAIEFSEDNKRFRVATGDSEIVTFAADSGEEVDRVSVDWRTEQQKANRKPNTPQLWEGDFQAGARSLVSSSAENLYVWDAKTGKMLVKRHMPHLKGCYVAFSADGSTIATSDLQYSGDFGEDIVRILDGSTGTERVSFPLDDARAAVMKFSPDGKRLFTGLTRGKAIIWDVSEHSPK